MTDLQKAKIKRNTCLLKFLEDNFAIFDNDSELKRFYKKLMSDHAQSLVSAEDLNADETSFSTEKLIAKKEVCEMAKLLCDKAKEAFLSWGDKDLFRKTKVGYLHFFRSNDFYTEERIKELHKLLNNHIKSLSPEHITEQNLEDFKLKIKTFIETKGSSSFNDRPPLEVTARLKADLKIIEKDVHYIYVYAEKYKKLNEQFYQGLLQCNLNSETLELKDTTLSITVFDADEAIPLQGVTISISKSSEKLISDLNGKCVFTNILSGRGIANFSFNGYKEQSVVIKIKPHKVNEISVSLKKD